MKNLNIVELKMCIAFLMIDCRLTHTTDKESDQIRLITILSLLYQLKEIDPGNNDLYDKEFEIVETCLPGDMDLRYLRDASSLYDFYDINGITINTYNQIKDLIVVKNDCELIQRFK